MSVESLGRPERHRIEKETFNLSDGPVQVELADHQLAIVHSERDLGLHSSYFLIIDPNLYYKGDEADHQILHPDEPVVIGRSSRYSGDRFEFSRGVSRRHASFMLRESNYGYLVDVEDLDSTNGTYEIVRPVVRDDTETVEEDLSNLLEKAEVIITPRFTTAGASVASELHPERNEDAYILSDEAAIIGVFDGMGGAAGSEVAAQIAAESVKKSLEVHANKLPRTLAQMALREALEMAHRDIIAFSDGAKIGTTATIAKVFENETSGVAYAVVASAGDSRAYIFRNGKLEHLTLDHAYIPGVKSEDDQKRMQTTLSEATDLNSLTGAEYEVFQQRNIITSHLGNEQRPPTITLTALELFPADRLIITTDGIHDNLTTSEIETVLQDCDGNGNEMVINGLLQTAQIRSRDRSHMRAKHDDMTAVILTHTG